MIKWCCFLVAHLRAYSLGLGHTRPSGFFEGVMILKCYFSKHSNPNGSKEGHRTEAAQNDVLPLFGVY